MVDVTYELWSANVFVLQHFFKYDLTKTERAD